MTIEEKFRELQSKNEAALIAYFTAGYPTLEKSLEHIRDLADGGADLIEIGVPFSDPVADGPVIQAAAQTALNRGVNLNAIIEAVGALNVPVPLVLMSYLNPLMAYGRQALMRDAGQAGIQGIIIPDLPLEEGKEWESAAANYELNLIYLVTPVSSEERIREIASRSRGFVYCVSTTGITGMRREMADLAPFIQKVKSHGDIPAAVGFGLSTPEHVRAVSRYADGAIIGSRFIKAVQEKENLKSLCRSLKKETVCTI